MSPGMSGPTLLESRSEPVGERSGVPFSRLWQSDALLLFLPLASLVVLRPGSGLNLFDVVLGIASLFVPGSLIGRRLRGVLVSVAAWAFAVVLSNHVNELPFGLTADGLFYPARLAWTILGVVALTGLMSRRLLFLGIGVTSAAALGALVHPTDEILINGWKFGYGEPLVLLGAFLTAAAIRRPVLRTCFAVALVAAVTASLLLNARSLALLAAFGVLGHVLLHRSGASNAQRSVLSRIMVLGIVATLGFSGYSHAARSGVLGYEQQWKFAAEWDGPLGLLVRARPEFPVSLAYIRESPWLGHGSSHRSTSSDVSRAGERLLSLSIPGAEQQTRRIVGSGLNAHSLALSPFVSSGVLGFVPWVLMLIMLCRAFFMHSVELSNGLAVSVGCALTVWDILFSPWRPGMAAWIVIVLCLSDVRIRSAEIVRRDFVESEDCHAAQSGVRPGRC
jgi:O-antigen ligase